MPPVVLSRLETRIQRVRLHDVLLAMPSDPVTLYFPHRGTVLSLVCTTDTGSQLEVALIGPEGFISVESLIRRGAIDSSAIVLAEGDVTCVSAMRLRAEFASDSRTRTVLLDYLALYVQHLTQNVVCSRIHSIEQRLSKWLLALRDRAADDGIHVSHDLLSKMLGIQRSSVTLAIGNLNADGIVERGRESIRVIDANALAGRACECFEMMQRNLDQYRAQRTARGAA
ncbi:MAG: Crp/Fnr family transcriptional regulator [Acidobacteria bacterium]|nr:Crp/Fnr family transcriptional regulator [Acidobacteriota bacterium]MBV9067877.1 Crp/Fnr family transcriptional regulator [Acidobacteriota bacterium]MBV9186768.1 Crp/Fnr family transcriptional regulator [Acidobacteriota bacterium]